MTRVAILAASPVVRAGLETLLQPGFEIVASPEEADVVVTVEEDELPEVDAPMLVLADGLPVGSAELASGWLPRQATARELHAAVEALAAGLTVVHPALRAQGPLAGGSDLTPRELEVLRLMAEGHSNKIVAYRLGVSPSTVKFHVSSILDKLGAGGRTDAVRIGLQRGLVIL